MTDKETYSLREHLYEFSNKKNNNNFPLPLQMALPLKLLHTGSIIQLQGSVQLIITSFPKYYATDYAI